MHQILPGAFRKLLSRKKWLQNVSTIHVFPSLMIRFLRTGVCYRYLFPFFLRFLDLFCYFCLRPHLTAIPGYDDIIHVLKTLTVCYITEKNCKNEPLKYTFLQEGQSEQKQ